MKYNNMLFLLFVFAFFIIGFNAFAAKNEYSTDLILDKMYGKNENYDYDLLWDNMVFTYIEDKSFDYNEITHEYDLVLNGLWSDNNNEIEISNKSINDISVSLEYKSIESYENIIGYFNPNNYILGYDEKCISRLILNGELNNKDSKSFTIGTITIKIQ